MQSPRQQNRAPRIAAILLVALILSGCSAPRDTAPPASTAVIELPGASGEGGAEEGGGGVTTPGTDGYQGVTGGNDPQQGAKATGVTQLLYASNFITAWLDIRPDEAKTARAQRLSPFATEDVPAMPYLGAPDEYRTTPGFTATVSAASQPLVTLKTKGDESWLDVTVSYIANYGNAAGQATIESGTETWRLNIDDPESANPTILSVDEPAFTF